MSSFYSNTYAIQHLQLGEIQQPLVIDVNSYVVIWCDEIPLGNFWYQQDQFKEDVTNLIIQAIQPAVEYYSNVENDDGAEWISLLQAREFTSLSQKISSVIFGRNNETESSGLSTPVSVVICTRNRPNQIRQCLEAFASFDRHQLEIIVVDNAPDDESTKQVVSAFSGVRYILEDRKGLDIARNTGARNALHHIIAYTDDDVIVPSNWIDNIRLSFSDPLTIAVTGLVMPYELNTKAQVIFEKDWGFNKGYLPKHFDHKYFNDCLAEGVPAWDIGAGANMAFRREVFELVGWFDERLDVGAAGCSGDSEMWYRILAEGWNCFYQPGLYVYHIHRSSMTGLKNQLFHYMRGHACALLIQYENYHHQGNLKRLDKHLPAYYFKRAKNWLLRKGSENNTFLFTEIRGLIAGRKYYNKYAKQKRRDYAPLPAWDNETAVENDALVSVIIPCYNQSQFLKRSINSILNQTHHSCEVIVVDDGSIDDTHAVCVAFGDKVKYVRVERVGLSAARNIGVNFSHGKYLVFLDADDYLYGHALHTNLGYFKQNPSLAYVSGGHVRVDINDNILDAAKNVEIGHDHFVRLLLGNYIAMEATVMYRRELFFHFHFDTSLASCEDYDLNLRIAKCFPVYAHSQVIAAYCIHGQNMSGHAEKMLQFALEALLKQQHGLIYPDETRALDWGMRNWKNYYLPLIDPQCLHQRIPIIPPYIAPASTIGQPLWSVMIPAFNCGVYLKQTLESILVQCPDASKMQIEVVDDGSTDISVEQLVADIGHGRISYHRHSENKGSLRCFETCINRAKGQLVHILHGDDFVAPGFYAEVEALFEKFPEAGAACTGFTHVDENGRFIYASDELVHEHAIIPNWLQLIAVKQRLQTPAVVVRRIVYEHLGGYFGVHYGEDWEMWVRIAANYPVAHSPQRLAHYRIHLSNISSRYFISGQNIRDIDTVIKTIGNYLPVMQKTSLIKRAKKNWSHYFAATSDMTYGKYKYPRQALKQSFMAFKMHQSPKSFYYLVKTFAKVALRYKIS